MKGLLIVRHAYAITAALLLGGTAATVALQGPGIAQDAGPVTLAEAAGPPRAGAPVSFADLAARLQPAVVNIATRQKVEVGNLVNPFSGTSQPIVEDQQGGGSGFIISADGLIVTNNHVITGGPNGQQVDVVTVKLTDRTEYKARIVGRDVASDLAVLKIEPKSPLPYVEFGDSSKTRVGDWVVAIGNPFGLGSTVTAGIVSAMQRNTGQGGAYDRFIQTDTAINRGNSGGPLFDLNGRVIGINNRLISPVGANIGINFAIPADAAIPVVNALKGGGAPKRGYLGIAIEGVDEDLAAALGLPKDRGEFVQSVTEDGGAAKAGIKAGDVILKVNGKDVTPDQTLSYIVANTAPGTRIPLELIRGGKPMTIQAVVGTRPSEESLARTRFDPEDQKSAEKADPKSESAPSLRKDLGLVVSPLTADIAEQVGIDAETKGLVVESVVQGSAAAQRNLRRGDVIMSADGKPVLKPEDLVTQVAAVKKKGLEAILLEVRRRGIRSAFVPLRFAN